MLHQNHDVPAAGHLGFEKTVTRVREVGYWVGMLSDIDKYCRECTVCQSTKPPAPANAPLVNVPIGKAWEMVAVDILEVPVSHHNNRYLLVVQDYMTKWVEAIPIPNQTAKRITTELVNIFSRYGLPDILHSDQGRNFESTISHQTLDAFGVAKSRTTAYHPAGDGLVERFNRSLLQMPRAYVQQHQDWEQYLPLVLYAYRTAVHASTGVSPFEMMFGRQGHKGRNLHFPQKQHMTCIPIKATSVPNLPILLNHTMYKPVHSKSITLISMPNLELLPLVMLSGYQFLQLVSWIQDGREAGQ